MISKKQKRFLKKKAELFLAKSFELSQKGLPELPLSVFADLSIEEKQFVAAVLADGFAEQEYELDRKAQEMSEKWVRGPGKAGSNSPP